VFPDGGQRAGPAQPGRFSGGENRTIRRQDVTGQTSRHSFVFVVPPSGGKPGNVPCEFRLKAGLQTVSSDIADRKTVSWNQLIVGLSDILMLAQGDGGAADGGAAGAAPADGGAAGNGGAAPGNGAVDPLKSLIPIVAVGVFMYFIVIRPQYKAQKEKRQQHEALMANLKKNDKVVTIGGIIGTVAEVSSDRVTIKIDDNTRLKVLRSAVQELLTDKSETTDKQDSQ